MAVIRGRLGVLLVVVVLGTSACAGGGAGGAGGTGGSLDTCGQWIAADSDTKAATVDRMNADLTAAQVQALSRACAGATHMSLADAIAEVQAGAPQSAATSDPTPAVEAPTASAEDPFLWEASTDLLQDGAGYMYKFDVSLRVLGPSSDDITNSAPGRTMWIAPPIQVSVIQENLTPGRNEPKAVTTFAVYWQMPADLCAQRLLKYNSIPTVAVTPDGATVLCPVIAGTAPYVSQDGSVPAGESLELADTDYSALALWQPVMSEADAATFAATTAQPPQAWAIFVDSGPTVPPTTYLSTMWNYGLDNYEWRILASKNMPAGVQG